jgi:hypothetical protein
MRSLRDRLVAYWISQLRLKEEGLLSMADSKSAHSKNAVEGGDVEGMNASCRRSMLRAQVV